MKKFSFGIHTLIGVLTLSSLGIVYAAWNDDVTNSDTLTVDRWNDLVTQVEGIGGGSGKFINGTDTNDAVYTTGNVGIGTNDPGTALHVNGRASFGVAGTSNGELSLYPSNGSNAWVHLDNRGDNSFRISHGATPGGTDLLTINTSSGNVGIGTTTPSAKLHVNGAIKVEERQNNYVGTCINGNAFTSTSYDASSIPDASYYISLRNGTGKLAIQAFSNAGCTGYFYGIHPQIVVRDSPKIFYWNLSNLPAQNPVGSYRIIITH